MIIKRVIQSTAIIALLLCVSPAMAQYGSEPFIEGFVGGNLTLPTGNLKNNLSPDSLNAKLGYGFDMGGCYYIKPQVAIGLYFNSRNMKTQDFDLYHRVFEFGVYGKYLLNNLSNTQMTPYLKVSGGLSFSKFAEPITDGDKPVYSEISHNPVPGIEGALGLQTKLKKDNTAGGIFIEAAAHYDMVDKSMGKHVGSRIPWTHGNALYFMLRGGIYFNISHKE